MKPGLRTPLHLLRNEKEQHLSNKSLLWEETHAGTFTVLKLPQTCNKICFRPCQELIISANIGTKTSESGAHEN